MNTPIFDFVKEYSKKEPKRFHMPGHKGNGNLGIEALDITEIPGADALFSDNGIISESMENARKIFGTALTLYSCEGSSLSIKAMLYLSMLCKKDEEKPLILAARNAHKVFINAAALLDFEIEWLWGDSNNILSQNIDANILEKKLKAMKKLPLAFYITSPDYLGNISDIKEISRVCKKYGVLLLCDNAHGAYLKFLENSMHPIDLGADICCDSAHKTLPCLTGAAYLHISHNAPEIVKENARNAMSLFASTSPSYLILESLDLVNPYLDSKISEDIFKVSSLLGLLKKSLGNRGFEIISNEPLKLTIKSKPFGYTGFQIDELLRKENIFSEFCDNDFITFMLSASTKEEDIISLEKALLSIERKEKIKETKIKFSPKKIYSPREMLFKKRKTFPLLECENKILADINISCPPAVPILVCGEKIDAEAIKILEYYNIENCSCLDE